GLRDYHDGDEARSIHWRRSASLGRMAVRDRQRDAVRRFTLILDEARPANVDVIRWQEGFEHMLSQAAALAARAQQEGASVETLSRTGASAVVLPGQPVDPVWRYLALLTPIDAEGA